MIDYGLRPRKFERKEFIKGKKVGVWVGPRLGNTGAKNTMTSVRTNVSPTTVHSAIALQLHHYRLKYGPPLRIHVALVCPLLPHVL